MSNSKPGMLIFAAAPAPRFRSQPYAMAGSSRAIVDDVGQASSRVCVETVAVNLRAVIEQVSDLIRAAQEPAGELGVAHVDINLSIAADGSVGLLGTGTDAREKGTLTVRLQPRVASQGACKQSWLLPARQAARPAIDSAAPPGSGSATDLESRAA